MANKVTKIARDTIKLFLISCAPCVIIIIFAALGSRGQTVPTIGVIPAPPQLGIVLSPSGGDDTAQLQKAYDNSPDGGTIYLRPSATTKRFVHFSALSWTGTKSVTIDMAGCELYSQFAISGTQASITWGGSPGNSVSNVRWTGGNILGALAVQNVNYSKHIDPESAATLIIQANGVACAYNDFHIGSLSGSVGNGSALIYNQINPGDWCNCDDIYGCSMHGTPVNGQPSPVIWQVNQTATFAPSAGALIRCRFEGDNQVLFNVGEEFNIIIDSAYQEGSWTEGTGGSTESFTWVNMPHNLTGWLSDYRNIDCGVRQ